jgi:hypothetical protein
MDQFYALPQINFVIPIDILGTNVNAISNPCRCLLCTDDAQCLPEDDEDRSAHIGVNKLYVKYNFNTSAFVGFIE